MTISQKEFKHRVAVNTKEYLKQNKYNSFDLKKYYGFDCFAGKVSKNILASKTHDIMCAVMLGFLPILQSKIGVDAVKLCNRKYTYVELKNSYTDESKLIRTNSDCIMWAVQNKIINDTIPSNYTGSLRNRFNATYQIANNLEKKGLETYFTMCDSRTDELIECYVIKADNILQYLTNKAVPMSGKIKIGLPTIEKIGKKYKRTIIPAIGFEQWTTELLMTLPLIKIQY